jgi:ADP-ribose pyrophosphatase
MLKKLDKIDSKTIMKNPWWEYRIDNYIMPNGKESEYHYVYTPGSVFVIPRTRNNTFIMIRQYRYLNQRVSIEFPGGGLKVGISSENCALEELREEAGYIARKLNFIGEFNPFNGVTDEICKVFLADDISFIGNNPEDSEEFEILNLETKDIINLINKGAIWDGMTLAAWSIYCFSEYYIKE